MGDRTIEIVALFPSDHDGRIVAANHPGGSCYCEECLAEFWPGIDRPGLWRVSWTGDATATCERVADLPDPRAFLEDGR